MRGKHLATEREPVDPGVPAWAVPLRPAGDQARARPRVIRGVVFRAVIGGAVAVGLLATGHRWAALVLVVVMSTTGVLSLVVPAVGAAIDRATGRIQSFVGRVLATVLLGGVHVVVFVPASLVLRLLRRDPLALGASADDPTFWRPVQQPRRPLHKRPFTYERYLFTRPRRVRRVTAVVGALVLAVGLDLGAGTMVGVEEVADTSGDDAPKVPDVGAAAGEPWIEELWGELEQSYLNTRYQPFVGWRGGDVAGDHVTVTDGIRATAETALASDDPLVIWFFGGSTMFGAYQRDEHTIPSQIVRLAEEDRIAIRAVNYGQAGHTNWQQMLFLQELLASGDVPDLVVFYEGANEIVAQFTADGPSQRPTHILAHRVATLLERDDDEDDDRPPSWEELLDTYNSNSLTAQVWRRIRGDSQAPPGGPTIEALWRNQGEQPAERGVAAAAVHGHGVELVESLASGYGFRPIFFWQPWIYSKQVVPGEEGLEAAWGNDPEAWSLAAEAALANLNDSVIDITDALDGLAEPVMYDFVHTNETGARVVAQAIYAHLEPVLVELAADRARGEGPV